MGLRAQSWKKFCHLSSLAPLAGGSSVSTWGHCFASLAGCPEAMIVPCVHPAGSSSLIWGVWESGWEDTVCARGALGVERTCAVSYPSPLLAQVPSSPKMPPNTNHSINLFPFPVWHTSVIYSVCIIITQTQTSDDRHMYSGVSPPPHLLHWQARSQVNSGDVGFGALSQFAF